jgi:hypothetical protein
MMLSEEAGGTPSSDLLVELAAAFDVLSIGIPTSTPVMDITYGANRNWFHDTRRIKGIRVV